MHLRKKLNEESIKSKFENNSRTLDEILSVQIPTSFKIKEHKTSQELEIIHTDLCGPKSTKIFQGEHYFMLLIDDYTRMTWVTFLKEKSEAFIKFKAFKALVENQANRKITYLRPDNGGEFTSNEFNEFW